MSVQTCELCVLMSILVAQLLSFVKIKKTTFQTTPRMGSEMLLVQTCPRLEQIISTNTCSVKVSVLTEVIWSTTIYNSGTNL